MKNIIIGLLVLSIFLISGCESINISDISKNLTKEDINKIITCDSPYIRHGYDCCLDQDNNAICDNDEISTSGSSSGGGSSGTILKECLYKESIGITKAMGIFCNINGLNDCIQLKDNLEQFKSIQTGNLLCSTTTLKKIVSSSGGFVNCNNNVDDCYRILGIQKPFNEFNVIVCEDEFCKITVNYDSQLYIKQPELEVIQIIQPSCTDSDNNDIYIKGKVYGTQDDGTTFERTDYCTQGGQLAEFKCDLKTQNYNGNWGADFIDCQYGCSDGACIKTTCGDNICGINENCVNCINDCGCSGLKKIGSNSGGFFNCLTVDDCYRMGIQKPSDGSNTIVCDEEFCKTTAYCDVTRQMCVPLSIPTPSGSSSGGGSSGTI